MEPLGFLFASIVAATGFRRAHPHGVSRCICRCRKNGESMYPLPAVTLFFLNRKVKTMETNPEGSIHTTFLHVFTFSDLQSSECPTMFRIPFWRIWSTIGPVLAPTGFWRGPEVVFCFLENYKKNENNDLQEGVLKKTWFVVIFWMPKCDAWNGKKMFSH